MYGAVDLFYMGVKCGLSPERKNTGAGGVELSADDKFVSERERERESNRRVGKITL
jgi:hypothetical protein